MRLAARSSRAAVSLVVAFAAALLLAGAAHARMQGGPCRPYPNVDYDGRFQLIRLRYIEYRSDGWCFDYPWMEENLMTMFDELTTVKVARKGSNILTMDDPELFKWPVAYLSEPGFWYPNESEAKALRNWIKKGGFLIVDDFYEGSRTNEWAVFERAMMTVLPDARMFPLTVDNSVFDTFYRIRSLDMTYPSYPWHNFLKAQFLGIYEDNDPKKRLIVVINYNNDLGDYMEHSGQGLWPVNTSNDAYKFAMNYIIFGLSN